MRDLDTRYAQWEQKALLWWTTEALPELRALRELLLRRRLSIIFGAVYVLLSVFTMAHFLHSSLLGDRFLHAHFEDMYQGNGWKPFVYRVLVPQVTKGIVELTPQFLEDGVNNEIRTMKGDKSLHPVKQFFPPLSELFPERKDAYPRVVMILLIYGCLWGYIVMLLRLAAQLFPGNLAIFYFSPVFALLAISAFSAHPGPGGGMQYPYDIPVLFLSTACYYCIAAEKWRAYLLFFLLACLNKESSIFIFLFFTIWCFRRIPKKMYIRLWAAQCVLYVIIKITLMIIYIRNPGHVLDSNISFVLEKDVFALATYTKILAIAVMFFLFTYDWREKPLFLKYVFWVFPCIYVAYLFYGWPGEYRVFFDILPLLILLGTHTLIDAAGFDRLALFRGERDASVA